MSDLEIVEIKDHLGYGASRDGRIWTRWIKGSHKLGLEWRELSLNKVTNGYLQVHLYNNKKRTVKLVHRLIYEVFVGPIPDDMEVCHNDGTRRNNNLDNLRIDTPTGNVNDCRIHGTLLLGSDRWNTNFVEQDIKDIRKLSEYGYSHSDLAKKYNVARVTIYQIVTRRRWGHVD